MTDYQNWKDGEVLENIFMYVYFLTGVCERSYTTLNLLNESLRIYIEITLWT